MMLAVPIVVLTHRETVPSAVLARRTSGWTLHPRVAEALGQFTGCPDGQRNAAESECLAAVQEAAQALGLRLRGIRVVDEGADGLVPGGCSYSHVSKRAMFNRNPAGRSSSLYELVCIEDRQPPDDGGERGRSELWKDSFMGANALYMCTGQPSSNPQSVGSVPAWATGFEWMRLPAGTHLLLYGTSHIAALSAALRSVARHLGVLEKTDTLSFSNFCADGNEWNPPDTSCDEGFGGRTRSCRREKVCGPEAQPCDLHMSSIVRDHLAEGSTITTIANHAQSQLRAEDASRWAAHLTSTLGQNFTHGAFMVPHNAAYFQAQCKKYTSNVLPDPAEVGDQVEPCGDGDGSECVSTDPRFRALSQWVAHPMAKVLRPSSTIDPKPLRRLQRLQERRQTPLTCVTDEQLAAGCGGVRNSTVWLSQGFLPEMQAAETADCSCDRHLCAGTCTKTDEELRCSPAQGVGVAWLVLRASGL